MTVRDPYPALLNFAAFRQTVFMSRFQENARTETKAMRGVFGATLLQRKRHFSERYSADKFPKREDLNPVRSHKVRGAFYAMRQGLNTAIFQMIRY